MFNSKPVEPNSFCPLIKKGCIKDQCKFWVHVKGVDPQSGALLDFPDCAIRFLPTLLIKNSQETHQLAGAVETARNETKKNAAGLAGALLAVGKVKLVEGDK